MRSASFVTAAAAESLTMILAVCFVVVVVHQTDWILLHDQPVPGGHSHSVLRDEEARDGADAPGKGPLPFHVDAGQHLGERVGVLLPPNHQIHRPLVAAQQAAPTPALPGLPEPEAAGADGGAAAEQQKAGQDEKAEAAAAAKTDVPQARAEIAASVQPGAGGGGFRQFPGHVALH